MREIADFTIRNEEEYEQILIDIQDIMDRGESNLTLDESDLIRNMAVAVQSYENKKYRTAT